MRKTSIFVWAAVFLRVAGGVIPGAECAASPLAFALEEQRVVDDEGAARVPAGADWLVQAITTKARVYRAPGGAQLTLANGLVARSLRLVPNAATVAFDNLMTGESLLRGVKPEAAIVIDGVTCEVGGLRGQPNYAYLDPRWLSELVADPGALQFAGYEVSETSPRMPWKRVRHHDPHLPWPPPGVHLRMDYELPSRSGALLGARAEPAGEARSTLDRDAAALAEFDSRLEPMRHLRLSVHYELYDGLPVLAKWITVHNGSDRTLRLDHFTSEKLALVEYSSSLDEQGAAPIVQSNLHVETDYTFVAGNGSQCRHCVHWVSDPDYLTQVDYERRNPCLLEVRPTLGPSQEIGPGGDFESFRTFELVFDSTERERRGLALRRFYRALAPWVTENPLMMHVRTADWDTVKNAIDQCAAAGFEMVILTFGSGFDIEDDRPEVLAQMKEYADYARSRGIEMGGYSLLASRAVGGGSDVVMPPGERPIFGNSPCLQSRWASDYFRKLHGFFEATGFMLLEHDGSYPGDVCAATDHPGHRGLEDSRWNQWRLITTFYRWCRERGIYLNVPDWYYLSGANKCGMGYRETNWSLPRAEQVIHTRQNIYDGTWGKTPSMGWMFVPLVEYHGGGDRATIEPLREHLDHYGRMLASNLALGVQACYRGPRLFDVEETRLLVSRWVRWYKRYREILESDVIHGRRADGRDLDWMLHVNPHLAEKALLVVFNPLDEAVSRELEINLYYAGLTEEAFVREQEGTPSRMRLARDHSVKLDVAVPASGMTWFVVEDAASPR
ncbi:MAG: hypothetical protein AB1486_00500 [Planctomycetota bacterium]